jgi:hypothetical protein
VTRGSHRLRRPRAIRLHQGPTTHGAHGASRRRCGAPGGSPKNLFDALRSGLPEEFHVFHDYAYLGSVQPRGAIDFSSSTASSGCSRSSAGRRRPPARRRHLDAPVPGGREDLDESPSANRSGTSRNWSRSSARRSRALPRSRRRLPFVYGHAVAFPVRRRRLPRPAACAESLAADRPLRRGPGPPRDARARDLRVLGKRPPGPGVSTSASSPSSASTSCCRAGNSPPPSAHGWSSTARRSSG